MHRSSLAGWQRVAAVVAPSVVVLVFAWALFDVVAHRVDSTRLVTGTLAHVSELREVRARLAEAETGQRGYIITGDDAYLAPYEGAKAEIRDLLNSLGARAASDADQLARVRRVDQLITDRLAILDSRMDIYHTRGAEAARAAVRSGGGFEVMEQLRALLLEMESERQRELVLHEAAEAQLGRRSLWILGIGALLTIGVAVLTNRLLAAQLEQVERLNDDLVAVNSRLQDQATELEMQAQEMQAQSIQLEESTIEVETSNEQLQQLNTELEERTQEAVAANRAKTEFLAAMSHELRTPLNAVTGYVDLLELEVHGPINTAQRSSLERIRHNSTHLLVLINDILNFARTQAGRVELRPTSVRIGDLIHDAEQIMAPLISRKTIAFQTDHDPDVVVHGDPDRIRQILLNLLTNAVKYTDDGGRVHITARSENEQVVIRVRDTGVGIDPAMHERIFDPFVQLRRGAGGGLADGVGLGLAISRELARAMEGELTVDSQPGIGSTFMLSLRRAVAAGPLDAAVSA
jgi:signal transduction histidine kinase